MLFLPQPLLLYPRESSPGADSHVVWPQPTYLPGAGPIPYPNCWLNYCSWPDSHLQVGIIPATASGGLEALHITKPQKLKFVQEHTGAFVALDPALSVGTE